MNVREIVPGQEPSPDLCRSVLPGNRAPSCYEGMGRAEGSSDAWRGPGAGDLNHSRVWVAGLKL